MPYSLVMQSERKRLRPFRRVLNKEDQEALDRLFDRAKMHTVPGVHLANSWPMETILLGTRGDDRGGPGRAPKEEGI